MSLLALKAAGITLGAPLFSQLDLTVHPGDRLAIVAPNGRGKSTLLQAMAGLAELTTGDITRRRGLVIGYLPQDMPQNLAPLTPRDAVRAVAPEGEDWRADIALDDLEIPQDLRDRCMADLSGGWQRLAMLARVWVTEPDLLLLDEPTNHLDLSRIGLVQRWIAALPRATALMVVSHDRAFLDDICTRTLFLRDSQSQAFALPFTQAVAALDEADAATGRQHDLDLRAARQLRRQAAKLKNIGINSGSDLLVVKTRQLTQRAAMIEAAATPAHKPRSAGEIRLDASEARARALISVAPCAVTVPGGRVLFQCPQLWIVPGDRVVLLGPNGVGKSRFVALVEAALRGVDGPVRAAPTVVAGIADQGLCGLDPDATPHGLVTRRFDLGDQPARTALAGAGIALPLQTTPIRALSGGQRARLQLLVLRLTRPNFFLLDEPTNHLDIEGQQALEDELVTKASATLLVSHDRSLIRTVGTRFWWIDGGRLTEVDSPEPFIERMLKRPVSEW
ncbi:MAG: ABC-F family ATP-binding cassette domain-containing protein [Tabrizicola sp.]|uniref:ABC-F family ATP-binding cassette domain-containing protein n=1 Tax=Tabrizicola sp. TaxID=2005166 RepID=UPI00273495E3|nr:ABC-F family ATP-binding cassette domain-containing protein [Tabrizicola sp.]MDP3262083.1 ABC-F family ATP-binding cassette domain-containing protein [Tabrizicola sp.]